MRVDRIELPQERVPGTDGATSSLILHAVTARNFTARVTVTRRAPEDNRIRYHDVVLTRPQLAKVIRELQARYAVMTDDVPAGVR
jgi:hypothetical protein